MKKYDKYAERNLRTQALGRYVFGISKEDELKPRTSIPIVFTDEYLETVGFPYADPLMIKLRIGKQ